MFWCLRSYHSVCYWQMPSFATREDLATTTLNPWPVPNTDTISTLLHHSSRLHRMLWSSSDLWIFFIFFLHLPLWSNLYRNQWLQGQGHSYSPILAQTSLILEAMAPYSKEISFAETSQRSPMPFIWHASPGPSVPILENAYLLVTSVSCYINSHHLLLNQQLKMSLNFHLRKLYFPSSSYIY